MPAVRAGGLLPDPAAVYAGYVNWPYNPILSSSKAAATSQTIYGIGVYLRAGATVTGIVVPVAVAGAGTPPTGVFVGIADSTGKMLAQSSNLASSSQLTATGFGKLPLSAPFVVPASGFYYLVALQNGSWGTTAWQYGVATTGGGAPMDSGLGSGPKLSGVQNGQAALPANGSSLTLTISTSMFLGAYL